jgi:hypothetical protein
MVETCNWQVFDLARCRHRDLLLVAENHRLIRRAPIACRRRFYGRTLAWLGRWMVTWGWRLQERYDVMSAAPAPQAANHAR